MKQRALRGVKDERITAPSMEQACMGSWFRPRTDWTKVQHEFYRWRAGRRLLQRIAAHLVDAGECPDYFPWLFMLIDREISVWGARVEGKEL